MRSPPTQTPNSRPIDDQPFGAQADPLAARPTYTAAAASQAEFTRSLQPVPTGLSPRLAAVVDVLPLQPYFRVLEIGCGTGAAARAVATRLVTGHILAIDRSAKAITQARIAATAEITSGRMSVRQVAAEDFVLQADEEPFDLVFAIRVGALDGRHPQAGEQALKRIGAATRPGARLFIDGGQPLRELTVPSAS